MSKIADAMISVQEAYEYAKQQYTYWKSQMGEYGYSSNVAAAEYHGRMYAFAKIQNDLLGDDTLLKDMEEYIT